MTKKDFEAIAVALLDGFSATLAEAGHDSTVRTRRLIQIQFSTCNSIAGVLATQNARFNRAKFLAACGIASPNSK